MRKGAFLLLAILTLTACGGRDYSPPAPVLNFGLHADSSTGGMIVNEGDTLWSISQRYRLPLRNIIDLNGLSPPYNLSAGQRLKLPAPVDYRTRTGDTLHDVAQMFHVSVTALARVNNLAAPYRLQGGQDLRIPYSQHQTPDSEETLPAVRREPVEVATLQPLPQKRQTLTPPRKRAEEPAPTTLLSSKRPDFTWPVRGKVISGYGPKEGGLYNDGINIAAPKGTPVRAAADGVVAYVGNGLKSYGNLVLIRHGGGMMTAYAHMSSVRVRKGTPIRKGQPIGLIGSTGGVSTSQLHFEIRQGSKTFDPKKYL